jgi:hypothetical protein
MLGGGPYSLARYFDLTFSGRILITEIDPGVTAAADADFGVPGPGQTRIRTVNDGARRVVEELSPAETVVRAGAAGSGGGPADRPHGR